MSVPAYLDGNAAECVAEDAEFVLAGVDLPGLVPADVLYPARSPVTRESVMQLTTRSGDHTVTYYAINYIGQHTPTTMAVVGAALAGNFRCGLTDDNHRDFYSAVKQLTPPDISWDQLSAAIGHISSFERTRITQDHHMYISVNELMAGYRVISGHQGWEARTRRMLARDLVYDAAKYGLDNQVSIITHLVYVLNAPIFAVKHLAWILASVADAEEYMSLLKAESGAAKQLQTLFRHDLAAVYELHVLRNRTYEEVDWEKEVRNRTHPNTVPIKPEVVYENAIKIFEQARQAGARQRRQTWEEYWALRWSHMPVGSVVSQYPDDMALKRSLPLDAKVKAAWFSSNRHADYSYWAQRQPRIYASTSTKYEWGKVRALYGCDVTSFIHADYAMSDCEDTLPPYFPVGTRANGDYVKQVINRFNDGVPFCYDFDDFNSQHSVASMQAVLKAWAAVFSTTLTVEQQRSLQWTIESISDQVVRFNDLGREVTISGTLMSGWRLTSFINSVLNRVYLMEAGVEDAIYALHNGDDVFATTATVGDAARIARKASRLGVRAQMAKMNIGTIGEFLRIDNRAKEKTSAQYLARAVATATHGRVEVAPANDLRELWRSMLERYNAIVARGGASNTVNAMLTDTRRFLCQLFQVGMGVLNAFENFHPIQGGFNKNADAGAYRLEKRFMSDDQVVYDSFAAIKRGISDYAHQIERELGLEYYEADEEQMFRKAVRALVRKKTRYEIVIERDDNVAVYRGVFEAWKGSAFITPIAKARSLGYITAVELRTIDNVYAAAIRKAPDSQAYMNASS